MVQEIFTPEVMRGFPAPRRSATRAIRRPATTSLINAQPIVIDCNKGKLALAHNGNLTNAIEVAPQARTSRLDLPDHERHGSDRAPGRAQRGAESCRALSPTR